MESGHFAIGEVERARPLLIAEGYATAATLHELTGMPALIAFNAGILCRSRRPYGSFNLTGSSTSLAITIISRKQKASRTLAVKRQPEATCTIGGFTLSPVFAEQDAGSDWNDLARGQGRDAAWRQLRNGFAVAERERMALNHAVSHDEDPDHSDASASKRNREGGQNLELER